MFARLLPFIFFGLALVTLFFGLILFAYLFIFGTIVGIVLFLIAWVKQRFFPSKQIMTKQPPPTEEKKGRTFDHEE